MNSQIQTTPAGFTVVIAPFPVPSKLQGCRITGVCEGKHPYYSVAGVTGLSKLSASDAIILGAALHTAVRKVGEQRAKIAAKNEKAKRAAKKPKKPLAKARS